LSSALIERSAARPKSSRRPREACAAAGRAALAADRERHGRDARGPERALPGQRERHGLAEELGERPRGPRLDRRLELDRAFHRPPQAHRRHAALLRPRDDDGEIDLRVAAHVAEHDRRVDRARAGSAASSRMPAAPPLPPLVETSVSVRRVARPSNTRASSISAAVAVRRAADPASARRARRSP
jgi:hypothetical protein